MNTMDVSPHLEGGHVHAPNRLEAVEQGPKGAGDRKSTRLNSSHQIISYAVFCLKKKKRNTIDNIKSAGTNTRLTKSTMLLARACTHYAIYTMSNDTCDDVTTLRQ